MKNIALPLSLIALLGTSLITGLWAQETPVTSKIDRVTVYRQGATIYHKASARIQAGNSQLIIARLSPDMDPNSIQVLSDGPVTLLSVDQRYSYLTEMDLPDNVQQWKKEMEAVTRQIEDLHLDMLVLDEEKALLEMNRSIKAENDVLNVERLQQFTAFFTKRMKGIMTEQQRIEREKRVLEDRRDQLKKQIEEQMRSIKGRRTAEIVLDIFSEKTATLGLEIRYLVNNAGWRSAYDVHGTSGSANVGITHKALIFNRSQEMWKDVEVTLSTGNPNRSSYIPNLPPWWLRFAEPVAYRREKQLQEDAMVMMEPAAMAEAGAPQTEMREEWTAVNYKLEGRYDIASEAGDRTVVVDQMELPAMYQYKSVPKMDPTIYLSALIPDWETAYLSPGEIHIFLDKAYAGKSYLNPATVADTMVLSLGRDEGVTIARKKMKSFTKKQFLGNKVSESLGYEITVTNKKGTSVELEIEDQLPVSTHEDISVDPGQLSGARFDKETGKLTWTIKLEAGQSRTIRFDFTVKYPKNKKIWLP